MTIEQEDVIDAIGVNNDNTGVSLSVFDHLPWNEDHFLLLERKLQTYVHFIESGGLAIKYPASAGKNVIISIYCKYRPEGLAVRVLEAARTAALERGVGLEYKPIPTMGYADD